MPTRVDVNCDAGEGFGPYSIGNDEALFEFVSSVNIACGFHAGDPATMRRTVRMAQEKKLAIGAHPGLPDRLAFGRRRWDLSPEEAYELVVYQVGALWGFIRAEGATLRHVKPHGALYNMAAENAPLAQAIARAIHDIDPQLILYGLAGSQLVTAGRSAGLKVCREAFADRTYEADGSLASRNQPFSMISDVQQAIRQVLSIVQDGRAFTADGDAITLHADTICIHGDQPCAAGFAKQLRSALELAGIEVQAP